MKLLNNIKEQFKQNKPVTITLLLILLGALGLCTTLIVWATSINLFFGAVTFFTIIILIGFIWFRLIR